MYFLNLLKRISSNPHFDNFKGFIIGGIIAIILGYCGNYLINKNLFKEELGLFSYHYNLMTLLASVASLGFYQAYLRFNNNFFNVDKLVKIVKSGSIILTLLLFVVSFIFFGNIYIASFSFLLLFNERIYYFRSAKKIMRMNVLKYIYSLILISCLLFFIKTNQLNFEKALFSYGIAYITVFLLGLFEEKSKSTTCPTGQSDLSIYFILKFCLPIVLTNIVVWVAQVSDQVIMKKYLSLVDLGNYAIGYRIIVVIQIFTSLFLLYYPMLYFEEANKKNFRMIKKIRSSFILLLFVVTIFLIIFRKHLYILLGATQYLDFTNIFVFLAIAEFIRNVSGFYLIYRDFTLQVWFGTVAIGIAALVSLTLNIMFIPKYGIYFAACVQLFAAVIYFVVTFFIAIRPEKNYFKLVNECSMTTTV
jgi:O-antigen/teichoic acid export membrane protein